VKAARRQYPIELLRAKRGLRARREKPDATAARQAARIAPRQVKRATPHDFDGPSRTKMFAARCK
jgi:hypothetical protein